MSDTNSGELRFNDSPKTVNSKVAVLGVGNILLSDEGVGVHIVEELRHEYKESEQIRFIDGGTLGMELNNYIADVEKLILVDAIKGDQPPGTIYKLNHDRVQEYFAGIISAHEVGVKDIFNIRMLLSDSPFEAVVIGVQPESLEISIELSDTVNSKTEKVKELISKQLKEWNIELQRIDE